LILTTLITVESTLFGIMVFGESITLFEIIGMVLVLIVIVILESESLSEYGRSKTPGSGTGCVQDQ